MRVEVHKEIQMNGTTMTIHALEPYKNRNEWFLRVHVVCSEYCCFIYDHDFTAVVQEMFNTHFPDIALTEPSLNWAESGMQEPGKFLFIAGVW